MVDVDIEEVGHDDDAHEGEILPWPERIPAAIKHAEEHVRTRRREVFLTSQQLNKVDEEFITAGELALAEALWEDWDAFGKLHVAIIPPALIAFTEKAESLG